MGRRNYFMLLALLAGLLIGGLEAYLAASSRRTVVETAKQRNANIAMISAQRLSGALREIDYIMRDVHDDVCGVMPSLRNGPRTQAARRINHILERKIKTHPWIFGFGIMNAKGIFVAGVDREGPVKGSVGADRSYREYFSHLASHPREESHCSGAFQELHTKDVWFAYSRAVRAEGRPGLQGVIYAGLYAKEMAALFGDAGFANSGAVAVVDAAGKLLLHIPPLREADGRRAEYPELETMLQKRSGSFQAITTSPWDGQQRISAFHKAEGLPYTIVVSSAVREELGQWRQQLRYQIAGVVLIIGLLLGAAWLAGRLLKAKLQLEAQALELERQAKTDVLTGISNRRHFFEMAERELMRSRRSGKPLALLMIDIDHFKMVNDKYGHLAGDEVLKSLCITSQGMIRNIDIVARIGGEEFAIILPETNPGQARVVAERLKDKLSETYIEFPNGDKTDFTVSIGIASNLEGDLDVESVMKRADAALYRAKRQGRNKVCG
jgi:diguanylate cyclase (GGDEF)-like protein